MRQKGQPLAVVIDEHGTVAGIATVEDLVEEIVGESGNDGKPPSPDVVREADGGLIMRGSMPIGDVEELLGVKFGDKTDEAVTTLAGLLSHASGKVPAPVTRSIWRIIASRCWKRTREKYCACGSANR